MKKLLCCLAVASAIASHSPVAQASNSLTYVDALMNVWDPELNQCLLSASNGKTYAHELTQLHCYNGDIQDLQGLEQFTAITDLELSGSSFTDMTAVASLTGLQSFAMIGNTTSDISALSGLTSLTNVRMHNNQISDVSPLANLPALTFLMLGNNPISDASPLSNLTQLEYLSMDFTQINNVDFAQSLSSLYHLNISHNNIANINGISGLDALTELMMMDNPQVDLKPMVDKTNNWQHMDLSTNNYCWQLDYMQYRAFINNFQRPWSCDASDDFNDYDGDGMANIDEVNYISNPFIDDILPPPPPPMLVIDAINNISDSGLQNCLNSMLASELYSQADSITWLHCPSANITSLAGIEAFSGLEMVFIIDNQISDLSPLASATSILSLQADGNPIADLSVLSSLPNLSDLMLNGAVVNDISSLILLPNDWNGLSFSANTYCWQLDYVKDFIKPDYWTRNPYNLILPATCNSDDDGNDYDGDGVSNATEIANGTNPMVN